VPYQTFKASDGWIIVACGNDGQYGKFVAVGGMPELARDARFARPADRVRQRELLVPLLRTMVAKQTSQWWIEQLEAATVPCGAINTLDQVFENPQVQARAMRIDIEREDSGPVKLVASPMKFSQTPLRYNKPPPRLGEHTSEILQDWLGKDAPQIAQWKEDGIV
jgi:formyl-CoA transferase